MRPCRLAAFVCLVGLSLSSGYAQLTTEQKLADFQSTAGIYVKGYGPLDWKKKLYNFDLLDTAPWAEKIRATKNDREFFEVMIAYVNSLNDAHSGYSMPSTFVARLNFSVDIYEGKLLVDFINRTRLPAAEYPFAAGYELVSIDGREATKLLDYYSQYNNAANERSTRRNAATLITTRPQKIIPSAPDVPEISTIVFRRYDGTLETYRIPWSRSGLAWAGNGKLPYPGGTIASARKAAEAGDETTATDATAAASPSYMKPLEKLWNCRLPDRHGILNFGSVFPVFQGGLPGTFVQRLGRLSSDFFFSGTYQSSGLRIGLIRIPSYSPTDPNAALAQFAREIAFMQENTDGLVVDETRNPGGSVSYMHALLTYLFHYPFRGMAFEVRPTSLWILDFSSAYESAKAQGAPQNILDLFLKIQDSLVQANRSGRNLTPPIPIDDLEITRQPATDNSNNLLAYSKPMIVLIDEWSASGGDAFAAVIQDNGRGPLFGYRTMGAGGNVTSWFAGSYSEGQTALTESLMSRATERAEDGGYPVSPYVENVGVRPDIEYDYMTRDNLFQNGKPFVDAFTAAMVDQIRKNQ